MLLECPECKAQISSEAPACPHCGKPQTPSTTSASAAVTPEAPQLAAAKPPAAANRTSGFLVAAGIVFVLCLFTPRLLLVLPTMACIVLLVISMIRKEPHQWAKLVVGGLALLLFAANIEDVGTRPSVSNPGDVAASGGYAPSVVDNLSAAKIDDWNWTADPTFGTNGAIKWNVSVRNVSQRPIAMAKVDLTTYDAAGKMVSTTSTYVSAIPPGETRSDNSFADYYGTEKKAHVVISDVTFAQ